MHVSAGGVVSLQHVTLLMKIRGGRVGACRVPPASSYISILSGSHTPPCLAQLWLERCGIDAGFSACLALREPGPLIQTDSGGTLA